MTQYTLHYVVFEDKNDFVVMLALMVLCEVHFVSKGFHLGICTGLKNEEIKP